MAIIYELTGLGGYFDVKEAAQDLDYANDLTAYNQDSLILSCAIYPSADAIEAYGNYHRSRILNNFLKIRENYNEGAIPNEDLLIGTYDLLDHINKTIENSYEDEIRIKQFNDFSMKFIDVELKRYYS